VTRLGGRVDPVSQSMQAIGKITGKPSELMAGMSGHREPAGQSAESRTWAGATARMASLLQQCWWRAADPADATLDMIVAAGYPAARVIGEVKDGEPRVAVAA
jgi:hypothetical protein